MTARRITLDELAFIIQNSSISYTMKLIGDRWSLLIILQAFIGTRRFDDFQLRLNIPRQTLNLRLQNLIELGLFFTQPYKAEALRVEYRLTEKALSMYGAVLMAWAWERKWNALNTQLPDLLLHHTCHHVFTPKHVCAHCLSEVSLSDLEPRFPFLPSAIEAPNHNDVKRRWGVSSETGVQGFNIVTLVSDRWILPLVVAVMMGCKTYDDLLTVLSIGSGVLANKLKFLVALGVLKRYENSHDKRRVFYVLTEKGRDLFTYVQSITQWTLTNFDDCVDRFELYHRPCSHPLKTRIVCSHCEGGLSAKEVSSFYAQDLLNYYLKPVSR